jgi:putative transposase
MRIRLLGAHPLAIFLRYDRFSGAGRSTHRRFLEIDHLGIARSPAFHYEPETNGVAEKALQTLKEQVLWIGRFDTLDELRTAVRTFGRTYNQQWLIERHGYRTPTETREHLLREGVDRNQRHEPEPTRASGLS